MSGPCTVEMASFDKFIDFLSSDDFEVIIFDIGKGGVGQTTLACLTAVYTAVMGYKTLLLTTDPAAHTGQVLDVPVTDCSIRVVFTIISVLQKRN